MTVFSTLFGSGNDFNVSDNWKIARQAVGDTFGILPALSKTVIHGDPSAIVNASKQWYGDISGQGQAVQDILNPPSAATVYNRQIQTYKANNLTMKQ